MSKSETTGIKDLKHGKSNKIRSRRHKQENTFDFRQIMVVKVLSRVNTAFKINALAGVNTGRIAR